MRNHCPLVSVVIPTRNRPELLLRAIRSVLAQTYEIFEVIVVIDGPDDLTLTALETMQDSRICLVPLAESVGGSEARNTGIRKACGEWVALLDDDDEWFPEKLQVQVEHARGLGFEKIVMASQYIDCNGFNEMVRPQQFQQSGQHISEYLFGTVSLFHPRQGFVQTSTVFAPRQLFLEVPFTRGLLRNQDSDWLLRAVPWTGREIYILARVLTIFHNEQTRTRIGSTADWEYSCNWAIENKTLFTRSALGDFLATVCLGIIMKRPDTLRNALKLIRICFAHAAVTPKLLGLIVRNGLVVPIFRRLSPDFLMARAARFIYR